MKHLKRWLTFNSSRPHLWEEIAAFAESVPRGALVLDAGSGNSPYKSLFRHARYESADFEQVGKAYAPSTYVCDLQDIPVEDGRFDFIVFTQVLEHLPEPQSVLAELNRVLKPDGKIFYSGPLFYQEHEQPYDFYRYTQFGLHHLFSNTGFVIERLDWLEGFFGTVAFQLNYMGRYLPLRPDSVAEGILGYALTPIMLTLKIGFIGCSFFFHKLDKRTKFKLRGYPINYFAIASKKSASEVQPMKPACQMCS